MPVYDISDMLEGLQSGICRIIFKKKSNDLIRIMYGTWAPEVLEREKLSPDDLTKGNLVVVWDIEKNGLRSFDLTRVIDFTPNIELTTEQKS